MTSQRTVDRISRILALIPYVVEHGGADLTEIQERFGYTESELTRDLGTIFVCGLPGYGPGDLMEAYIDEDEVVIDAAEFFSKAPRLTATEALGLLASGMTALSSGAGSPDLESAVEKLTQRLIPDAEKTLAIDVVGDSPHLGALRSAASERNAVEIEYWSVGKDEITHRVLEPWRVFTTMGRWYVVGLDRYSDEQRTFRVDRIREMAVTDEKFEAPSSLPDPHVGYTPRPDDVTCEIELSPRARWVLEYYPVEVLDDSPQQTRILFHAPEAGIPARLLLRLGPDARLVSGEEVATKVRSIGAAVLASIA